MWQVVSFNRLLKEEEEDILLAIERPRPAVSETEPNEHETPTRPSQPIRDEKWFMLHKVMDLAG